MHPKRIELLLLQWKCNVLTFRRRVPFGRREFWTLDLRIFNPTLYHWAILPKIFWFGGTWTPNNTIMSSILYLLSYKPKKKGKIGFEPTENIIFVCFQNKYFKPLSHNPLNIIYAWVRIELTSKDHESFMLTYTPSRIYKIIIWE